MNISEKVLFTTTSSRRKETEKYIFSIFYRHQIDRCKDRVLLYVAISEIPQKHTSYNTIDHTTAGSVIRGGHLMAARH